MLLKYKPKRELGQNFLINKDTAMIMVNCLQKNIENIIEIGGGYGSLSKLVADNIDINRYTIYEFDSELAQFLEKEFKNNNKIDILCENFLDTDLSKFESYQIFGAIPYNITSPIIHKLLRENNNPYQITLLIQKEVADKIVSVTPRSNYWTYITLGYDVTKVSNVSRNDFNPIPKVDSAIIKLIINREKQEILKQIGFSNWSKFLHHVYKTPRKMLNKRFSQEILASAEIDSKHRPQNLSLENLLELYKIIYNKTG